MPLEPAAHPDPGRAAPRIGPFLWLALAVALIAWLARGVIGPFVVSAMLAYAFSPLVAAGERRWRRPRVVVVAIGYVIALLVLGLLLVLVAERLAGELASLASAGPGAVATAVRSILGGDSVDIAGQHVTVAAIVAAMQDRFRALVASPGDALALAKGIGEGALDAMLTLIVTFYLLVDGPRFMDRSVGLVPADRRARLALVLERIHDVLGKWLRGQLLLIALVAAIVYLVLGPLLHLPYALAIAILTGVLEIVPFVGPLVATVIAATDAFVAGGAAVAIGVVVFFFVLRQVEDQLVMPIVIGRAVHLHPVVTIFAVLVGLSAFGVLGGLLGVPVAAAVNVIFNELYPAPEPVA